MYLRLISGEVKQALEMTRNREVVRRVLLACIYLHVRWHFSNIIIGQELYAHSLHDFGDISDRIPYPFSFLCLSYN